MKVLIAGSNGQLGWELQRTIPQVVDPCSFTSAELDITDLQMVREVVQENNPDLIINAAAYTAVDKAEQDVERAMQVNCDGIANLAQIAMAVGSRVIHVSTDFVFDGAKSTPYLPEDQPNPESVYGQSKLAGEIKLLEIADRNSVAIVRTSWVYSGHGNNFVKTMLKLMAEREQLGIVADQVGSPTWARGLAQAIWQMVGHKLSGVYHWTDAGVASWYDFAMAIQEEALSLGMLLKSIPINPLGTKEYPTPAKRPHYSVMDTKKLSQSIGVTPSHWRKTLRNMLKELSDE